MRKHKILIAILAVIALFAAACGSDSDATSSDTTAETTTDETTSDETTSDETTESSVEDDTAGEDSTEPASGEPILVGVAHDLSGAIAPFGEQMVSGANLAVEQFNEAGGLDGRPVELIVEDLASDRAVIASATQKLADAGVIAIHGPTSSSALVVGAPVAEEQGLVMIPPGSQEKFGEEVLNKWVFRLAAVTANVIPSVLEQMQAAAPFEKLAVFYDPANNASVDDAKLLEENAATSGYELVASETAEEGATDFSSQISKISSAGADAIWMSHLVEENASFIIQARERGIDAQIFGGATFTNPEIFEIAGEAGEGAITYVPFLTSSSNPESQAFVEAFDEFEGAAPSSFNALGFDSMWAILHGLEAAETVDREGLRDAMSSLSFDGAVGTITWDGGGDNATPSVVLVQVENGLFTEVGN